MAAAQQKWSLSQEAFDGLLAALGLNRDAAAARYLEIHANLTRMFEWRGCPSPSEHADETISRVARKLADGEEIRDLATYCIGIGRMLVRELNRAAKVVPLDKAPELRVMPAEPPDDQREKCFERCLNQLSSDERDLILRYYQGDKSDKIANRKGLAALFGIGASALRMKALRLREKLQLCVEGCTGCDGFAKKGSL